MMEDGNKSEEPFDHNALVDKTNALLEETERLGDTWHQGKDSTESVRQLRILASGYIASLEKAVSSLGECMNQVLDENERLNYVNQEIARAATIMEELSRGLKDDQS